MTAYGEWKQKPAGTIPALAGVEPERAKRAVAAALTRGGGWLTRPGRAAGGAAGHAPRGLLINPVSRESCGTVRCCSSGIMRQGDGVGDADLMSPPHRVSRRQYEQG